MDTCLSRFVMSAAVSLACMLPLAVRGELVAGENVNMVSGTQWPGGDPYLQRQNEPAIAVSSVNPNHLMGGANDYRSVDIPFPAFGKKSNNGDAWLGVFKSLDGGQQWTSTLLAGYPQACRSGSTDILCSQPATACAPGTEEQCEMRAAADPVMRAGTDGMFYYSGINFSRDKARSRVFVARFLDANNKESGDPITHIDTRLVATAPPDTFVDKPWIAVDVPRTGALKCDIPADPAVGRPARSFPAGTIYVAWGQFAKPATSGGWADRETTSDILLSYSRDCGATWSTPIKLNTANSTLNQGVTMAVEPLSGRVYVAWRRVVSGTQGDAIMATRSAGRSRTFAAPRAAAVVTSPFEQGATIGSFRTQAMPTMAISSDGKSSWAHIAWQQRKAPGGDSRIYMTSATVFPPPMGDQDPDDPETSDRETRVGWQPPVMVDDARLGDDVRKEIFARGHQVMPSLTFSQGKLVLIYYDTRFDHTRRYYKANTAAGGGIAVDPATGRFYTEELAPIGDRVQVGSDTAPSVVFNEYITDVGAGSIPPLQYTRHTMDVRVASAAPGLNPVFTSSLVTRFPFGLRGDEYAGQTEPSFGNSPLVVTDGNRAVQLMQQLQMNPPNLPMFGTLPNVGPTKAFLGDYIDVRAPEFVPRKGGGGWDFNIAPTTAPVFHAVWTSNQDVKPPLRNDNGQWMIDWSLPYTAIDPGATSLYDGTSSPVKCTVNTASRQTEGSRDQNIYTSRLTEGLLVTAPQNAKPLPLDGTPATFVVLLQNSTNKPMPVSIQASTAEAGVDYRFAPFTANAAPRVLDLTIPAFSSASRTLFARLAGSTKSAASFTVTATETGCTACRSGSVTLNPAVAISSILGTDNNAIGTESFVVSALAPNITNPNITNPNITNPNITNTSIADVNYTISNDGNTTTSYRIEIVNNDPTWTPPSPVQLIVSKTYFTLAAENCALQQIRHEQLAVNNPDVSQSLVGAGETVPAPGTASTTASTTAPGTAPKTVNASVVLRPGESATITLRLFAATPGNTIFETAAKIAAQVAPAVVPDQRQDGVTTTYATAVSTSGIGLAPTTMTVGWKAACSDATYDCFGVTVAPTTGTGPPMGQLTVVRNGIPMSGPEVIFGGGFTTAQFLVTPPLAPGEAIVILYPGDAAYNASHDLGPGTYAPSWFTYAKPAGPLWIGGTLSFDDDPSTYSGVQIVVNRDGQPVAATVELEGTLIPPWEGHPGFYRLENLARPAAGSTMHVIVSDGGSLAEGTVTIPDMPNITWPTSGAAVPASPLTVRWDLSGTPQGISLEAICPAYVPCGADGTDVSRGGLAGTVREWLVDKPLRVGNVTMHVDAHDHGSFTGDVEPSSFIAVVVGAYVPFITY